jgi:hypothetical protein
MLGDECFADRVSRKTLAFVWITLFCLNLIFPLSAGMSLALEHGKIGILIAVLMLLAASTAVVARLDPLQLRCALAGSFLLCVSQFYPIRQILAGLVAYIFASSFGLIVGDSSVERFTSELGGFAMATIAGSLLLFANVAISSLFCIWARGY